MKKRTLLIDADILLFRYACVHEYDIDWGDNGVSKVKDFDRAKDQFEDMIVDLIRKTKCGQYFLCFTSETNFRYAVLPTYKHNRKDLVKPILHGELKDYFINEHPFRIVKDLEADDVMGVLATRNPKRYIISTIDKDLMQIPGYHYNWNKPKKGVFNVRRQEADRVFWMQCLTGDSTDGYTGVPGIGPKRATAILDSIPEGHDTWQTIVDCYGNKDLGESVALQQARVARILRAEDYDFKNKEVILWTP